MAEAPVTARLCGFDFGGVPSDHRVEWLRGKTTVEFAVDQSESPAWRIGGSYVLVPVPADRTPEDFIREIAGQTALPI
jgi:hypothetical protein